MNKIAQYEGRLLGHVETLYRPGERQLAIALIEALGCGLSDTGFRGDGDETFLAVHPNADDQNAQTNVFYMSPMRPEQLAVETRLARLRDEDAGFADELEAYRTAARTKPFGVPHFALRYRASADVEEVSERLGALSRGPLAGRLHLRIFCPEEADSARGTLIQGFLYQDVIVSGCFLMGQLIELQTLP